MRTHLNLCIHFNVVIFKTAYQFLQSVLLHVHTPNSLISFLFQNLLRYLFETTVVKMKNKIRIIKRILQFVKVIALDMVLLKKDNKFNNFVSSSLNLFIPILNFSLETNYELNI